MYAEINLTKDNGTVITLPMRACGTTLVRYKMIFNEELMPSLTNIMGSLYDTEQDATSMLEVMGNPNFDCISKMAYVMNAQATDTIKKANKDKYIDWLEQFDAMEFLFNAADIIAVYIGNRKGDSSPKKDIAPLTEK